MTLPQTAEAHLSPASKPIPLSRVQPDERGNLDHSGEFYRPREGLKSLANRVAAHLADRFFGKFALRGERYVGGRSLTAEVLDAPLDLSDDKIRETFEDDMRDEMNRFNFVHSNFYSDFDARSFYAKVKVGRAYYAALAARRGLANPVARTMSLAAFKRLLRVGDVLTLRHSSFGNGFLGLPRRVEKVQTNALVLEGASWLEYPPAAGFACDGKLIRIALGSAHDPDAHLLYEWCRLDIAAYEDQPVASE